MCVLSVSVCCASFVQGFSRLHTRQALVQVQLLCNYDGEGEDAVPQNKRVKAACDRCVVLLQQGFCTTACRSSRCLVLLSAGILQYSMMQLQFAHAAVSRGLQYCTPQLQ